MPLRTRGRTLAVAFGLGILAGPLIAEARVRVPDADPTVVIIVSARSSISSLPRNHLIDLYLGRTSRFPDGSPAVPIDQDDGSPTRDEFYETIVGRSGAQIKAHWAKIIFTGRGRPPRAAESGAEVKRLVAQNPNAIGYIQRELVDETVRVLRVR